MQFIVDTYLLEYVENENKYYISFKDSVNKECKLEINKKIFDEYVTSKKSYKKIQNSFDRYEEQSEQTEISIYNKSAIKAKTLEDELLDNMQKNKYRQAEKKLTETQIRRVEMHFLDNVSIRDLARLENVRKKQIEKSIQQGIKKIKKYFEN